MSEVLSSDEVQDLRKWAEGTLRYGLDPRWIALCDSWLTQRRHLNTLDSPHLSDALAQMVGADHTDKALGVIRLAMELADSGHEAGKAALAVAPPPTEENNEQTN